MSPLYLIRFAILLGNRDLSTDKGFPIKKISNYFLWDGHPCVLGTGRAGCPPPVAYGGGDWRGLGGSPYCLCTCTLVPRLLARKDECALTTYFLGMNATSIEGRMQNLKNVIIISKTRYTVLLEMSGQCCFNLRKNNSTTAQFLA